MKYGRGDYSSRFFGCTVYILPMEDDLNIPSLILSPIWNRISEGIFKSSSIGRIYTVHPKNLECFYLRLLVTTVKGPVSFKDIITVNGVICHTYKKACAMLDLLEDDEHWDNTH